MSAPLIDSVWGGKVTIGPQIKYAASIEASETIRGLLPKDLHAKLDAVIYDAHQRKNNVQFGCTLVVFEDWSIHAINTNNYETLCELTANQDAACVRCGYALQKLDDEQRAAVGEDAVSATGTTGGTTGEKTDGATA
jgi:hypothetical protein